MKINLKPLVKETVYSLSPYIQFAVLRCGSKWVVADKNYSYWFPFKLMNGEMAGGGFDTLSKKLKQN